MNKNIFSHWKTTLFTIFYAALPAVALAEGELESEDEAENMPEALPEIEPELEEVAAPDITDQINAALSPITDDITGLNVRINELQNQISNLPTTSDATYVAIVIAVIALIAAVGLFIIVRNQQTTMAKLNAEIKSLKNNIAKLESEQSKDIASLKTGFANSQAELNKQPALNSFVEMKAQKNAADSKAAGAGDFTEQEFLADFSALKKLANFEAKDGRDDFGRKYKIVPFACTNHEKRVNHPDIAPKYEKSDSLVKGKLWGALLAGNFVVVPNLSHYTEMDHIAAGMENIFDSNFESGNTYSKIEVKEPAIMTTKFTVIKKGKLELS